jgi:hypothetical protein
MASYRQSFPLGLRVVPVGLAPPAVLPLHPDDQNLLSAVCCLLSAVCCLLSAVCCLLSAACCPLNPNQTKLNQTKQHQTTNIKQPTSNNQHQTTKMSAEPKPNIKQSKLLSAEPKPNQTTNIKQPKCLLNPNRTTIIKQPKPKTRCCFPSAVSCCPIRRGLSLFQIFFALLDPVNFTVIGSPLLHTLTVECPFPMR